MGISVKKHSAVIMLIMILPVYGVECAAQETASRILQPSLLNRTAAFPLPQHTFSVQLAFMLEKIDDIDIDTQVVTLSGGARMRWSQRSLSWSPHANSGIEQMYIEPWHIWTPPLTVRNRGSISRVQSSSPVLVSSDGQCDQWVKLSLHVFVPDLADKKRLKISWSLGFSPPYSSHITLRYLNDGSSLLSSEQYDKVSAKWSVVKTEEYKESKGSPDTFYYCLSLLSKADHTVQNMVTLIIVGAAYFLVYTIQLTNCLRYFYAVFCFTVLHFMTKCATCSSVEAHFQWDWQLLWCVSVGFSAALYAVSMRDPRGRLWTCSMTESSTASTSLTSRPSHDMIVSSIRTGSSASHRAGSKSPSTDGLRFNFAPENGLDEVNQLENGSFVSEELGLKDNRSSHSHSRMQQPRSWLSLVHIIDNICALLCFMAYCIICIKHVIWGY